MNRIIFGNKGLTLVELILTISIIAIVIVSIFSFLQFNYITFKNSNANYNLQVDLSNVQRIMEKELKYADTVNIYENLESYSGENNYIYLENNQIKIKTVEGSYSITDVDSILITDLSFDLEGNLLQISIEGKSPDSKTVRNIDYSIELLNIENNKYASGYVIGYILVEGDD